MRTRLLRSKDYEEMKKLFLDVFSHEPWFDQWKDEKQLDLYMSDLTDNKNSLSLALYDENHRLVGGSLGYVFNWWEGREYFIKEFFIARDKQNQGVGGIFIDQINTYLEAQDIQHIWLATEKNMPAYPFYHKNGFADLQNSVFLVKKVNQP
ncbi:GNAT family N-acetyltransferase [Caldalkalibacillus salinus]|uniref:GNAT family N-acetyltransferase n=1 Tax=Caldalkalibacillus salinus TaxID=2803787 RepID=UPI001923C008|nr:GNAT family N-acetyltransferase [Caldalkalibacillus salinus]